MAQTTVAQTTERLAACDLIRTRFAGRADLRRSAEDDPVALATLEHRLGIRDEGSYLVILRDAMRREVHGERASVTAAAHLAAIRGERKVRRGADPLAARESGYAVRTIARRRADEAIAAARFREATHGHETRIRIVDAGSESAACDTVRSWSDRPCNSYDYPVTLSTHTWHVSPAILTAEVRALNAAASRGVVYLSTTVRVRQGRGTSLVVEHLSPRQALRALREAA